MHSNMLRGCVCVRVHVFSTIVLSVVSFCTLFRDLLVLDSPPSSLNRVQVHNEDYYETSGFSPVSTEVTKGVSCKILRL